VAAVAVLEVWQGDDVPVDVTLRCELWVFNGAEQAVRIR